MKVHKILVSYAYFEPLHLTLQGGPTPAQEVVLNRNFLLSTSDHCCP